MASLIEQNKSLVVPSMPTDGSLLEGAKRMDRNALINIFDNYSSALYNYALRLCGDPMKADNIVGDVFAKLLDKFAKGKGPRANLRSYLYQMTYHMIVDEARFSSREAPLDVYDISQGRETKFLPNLENRIILDTLLVAIRNDLTEDQRHVIILRFIEGFSLRETAEIIDKKVQNVKVIQNRGIAKLRKVLDVR
jgi:RNA polymerase sigma-70 factor (ECF subfamily)